MPLMFFIFFYLILFDLETNYILFYVLSIFLLFQTFYIVVYCTFYAYNNLLA